MPMPIPAPVLAPLSGCCPFPALQPLLRAVTTISGLPGSDIFSCPDDSICRRMRMASLIKLAILILRHMLSSGQLKISLPGKPDIVVTARNRGWRAGKGQHPDKGASTGAGIGIGISLPRPSALLALVLRPDR